MFNSARNTVDSFSAVSEAKLITVELAVFRARQFDNARFRLIARNSVSTTSVRYLKLMSMSNIWIRKRKSFSVDEDFYLLAFVRAQLLTFQKGNPPPTPTSSLLCMHGYYYAFCLGYLREVSSISSKLQGFGMLEIDGLQFLVIVHTWWINDRGYSSDLSPWAQILMHAFGLRNLLPSHHQSSQLAVKTLSWYHCR